MSIATSAFHDQRVVAQFTQNLVGLQKDIASNCAAHLAMAQAQSPNLATLQTFIADCVTQYNRRAQWMTDWQADSTKIARLQAALARIGMTIQDIIDLAQPMRAAVIAFNSAPKTSYAEIVSACNALGAAVNMPPSLWPE
jgi:hypothetical protein